MKKYLFFCITKYDINAILFQNGRIKVNKYLHLNLVKTMKCKNDSLFMFTKNLKCLKYMHKCLKIPVCNQTLCSSARSGLLECLKYAHKIGASDNGKTLSFAAASGSFECLIYAYQYFYHDYTCESSYFEIQDEYNMFEENEYNCIHGLSFAAASGSLKCLKFAHEVIGLRDIDNQTLTQAAKSKSIQCVIYAYEKIHCKPNKYTLTRAAEGGSIECLKFIHKITNMETCEIEFIMNDAKRSRSTECLLYCKNHFQK